MGYAVGIDVGTTFSAAATWRNGVAATVALGDRAATVPSVLFLRDDGVMLVGDAANRRAITDPARVVRQFKRRVGDGVPVVVGDEPFSAAHLTAQMVGWVAGKVAEREGGPADYVVLTHPAAWGSHRLAVLAEAAATAGLPAAGLLPEPVAAGLYYASQQRVEPGALVAVYDLGGGTFDASLLRKTADSFELVGTPIGDDGLGGVDADQAVFDHVVRSVGAAWPAIADDDRAGMAGLAQVKAAAVEAKEALSSDTSASVPVVLPGLVTDIRMTRGELEDLVAPLVVRTVYLVRESCAAAGVRPDDLASVLLVGGGSRMPLVAQMVTSELRRPVAVDAHPKYAVCLGAAIAAAARLHDTAPSALARAPASPGAPAPLAPVPPSAPPPAPPSPGPAPAPPSPGTVIVADLEDATLTAPSDHRLPRSGRPRERPLTLLDRDVRVVAHIGGAEGDAAAERSEQWRVAAIAAGAVVAVVAVLAAVLALGTGGDPAPAGPAGSGAPVSGASDDERGTATLDAAGVAAAAPGTAMRGVAAVGGTLVAVGGGTDGAVPPAAWHSTDDGRTWLAATLAEGAGGSGAVLTGVAPAPGGGALAVGIVAPADGASSRATVWRAPGDARAGWAPVDAGGLDAAAALHDVLAVPEGLVAAGRDTADDPDTRAPGADERDPSAGAVEGGDGGIWRSADGVSWERVATTGLGGPGRQELLRLVRLPGGDYLAIGRARQGALTAPALWTSPDLVTWTPTSGAPSAPDGTPTVGGLAIAPDGTVAAAGTRPGLPGTPTGTDAALWWAEADRPDAWHRFATGDAPTGNQRVHAVVAASEHLVAVGSDGDAPAAWSIATSR